MKALPTLPLLFVACGPELSPFVLDCDATTRVTGLAWLESTAPIIREDVTITGESQNQNGRATRSISILGRYATNTAFNHREWQVTIPFESLQTHCVGNQCDLQVNATDACGTTALIDTTQTPEVDVTVSFEIDPTPNSTVDELMLSVELDGTDAGGRPLDYLPTDGSASATVMVVADRYALGQTVSMQSSPMQFTPAEVHLDRIVDGQAVGQTRALVTQPNHPDLNDGLAVITANGDGLVEEEVVRVSDGPQFIPNEITGTTGDAFSISLDVDGDLVGCDLSGPVDGLEVTVLDNGTTICVPTTGRTPCLSDRNTLTVDLTGVSAGSYSLQCYDSYGQSTGVSRVEIEEP